MLGQADLARARNEQMLAVANVENPYYVAISNYQAASLHAYLREYDRAEALAARSIEISEKFHLPWPAALSRVVLGHARAELGAPAEGVELIRVGRAALHKAGAPSGRQGLVSLMAARYLEGTIVEALETSEQALRMDAQGLLHQPEVMRLRGHLHLKQGKAELAETDFRESIAMARGMSAKAWELRTTMSLARLLDSQGRRDEARSMLTDIYNWFTEGFDTADLKDAKSLLDRFDS
jgi:hypothetical protein